MTSKTNRLDAPRDSLGDTTSADGSLRSSAYSIHSSGSQPPPSHENHHDDLDSIADEKSRANVGGTQNNNGGCCTRFRRALGRRVEATVFPNRHRYVTDAYTGLSSVQVKAIQDNWAIIKRDLRGNALELFIRYFAKHPEYKLLFPGLRGAKLREVYKNDEMGGHAFIAMQIFTVVVENLDRPSKVEGLIWRVGRNHVHHICQHEHFSNLRRTFIEFLAFKLGHHFGQQQMEAWNCFLEVFTVLLVRSMQHEEQKLDDEHEAASPTE